MLGSKFHDKSRCCLEGWQFWPKGHSGAQMLSLLKWLEGTVRSTSECSASHFRMNCILAFHSPKAGVSKSQLMGQIRCSKHLACAPKAVLSNATTGKIKPSYQGHFSYVTDANALSFIPGSWSVLVCCWADEIFRALGVQKVFWETLLMACLNLLRYKLALHGIFFGGEGGKWDVDKSINKSTSKFILEQACLSYTPSWPWTATPHTHIPCYTCKPHGVSFPAPSGTAPAFCAGRMAQVSKSQLLTF